MYEPKDSIMHYASPYYDPVKAHEYYMQHRKLKGRRSTSALSDEGKEVWAYTKAQITAEKKNTKKAEQEKKDAYVAQIREKAKQEKERIRSRLKELNERLSEMAKLDKDNSESYKERKKSNSEKAKEIRQNISSQLKAVVSAARESFKQKKKNIDASYESIYQREYDNILKEYQKPEKSKSTKKTK